MQRPGVHSISTERMDAPEVLGIHFDLCVLRVALGFSALKYIHAWTSKSSLLSSP